MNQFNEIGGVSSQKTFFTHVFSNSEEGKAEILNVVQYSLFGVVPVVILNKLIQRFLPEADPDKSSLEILVEIFIQLVVMFIGIILIHRTISYFPTYSGFNYDNLSLTNVILAFLIVVLSIQTKLGIKVNIIYDRIVDLWEGTSGDDRKQKVKKGIRVNNNSAAAAARHSPSQADYLDNSAVQTSVFPPAPVATSAPRGGDNYGGGSGDYGLMQPMAANSLLGSSFGSSF
jgi:hypothetical protein